MHQYPPLSEGGGSGAEWSIKAWWGLWCRRAGSGWKEDVPSHPIPSRVSGVLEKEGPSCCGRGGEALVQGRERRWAALLPGTGVLRGKSRLPTPLLVLIGV